MTGVSQGVGLEDRRVGSSDWTIDLVLHLTRDSWTIDLVLHLTRDSWTIDLVLHLIFSHYHLGLLDHGLQAPHNTIQRLYLR